MNTFHSKEEIYVDQGKDGQTNIHEDGTSVE
jgi:hypothetical protein